MIKARIQCLEKLILFFFKVIFMILAVPFHDSMICSNLGWPAVAGASSLGNHHMPITGFPPFHQVSRLMNPSMVVGRVLW